MPDMTFNDVASSRLLPIAIPAPDTPSLGEWHSRGLCAGDDPDVFFPSHGDPGTRARQICAACAVRADCLGYATDADEFGIWGGLDQDERRKLKRRQRRKKGAACGDQLVEGPTTRNPCLLTTHFALVRDDAQ